MNRKRKPTVMSAIDIGSYSLKMRIVEVDEEGNTRLLDRVTHPAALGKDTFSTGKVSYETVEHICEILTGFQQLMQEYGSRHYRALATSAIREAENREYLIDQIRLKTGLKVEVINNAQERYLTYKAIRENLPDHQAIREEGVLVVEVGSGSIEMTIYDRGSMQLTHNIKLGHLRLREVLSDLEKRSLDFPRLLEEYIESHLDAIQHIHQDYPIRHLVVLGSEMKAINRLCNDPDSLENKNTISIEALEKLFKEVQEKPAEFMADTYQISMDLASILLPSLMIMKKFFQMTEATQYYTPLVSLSDGIVSDFIDQRFYTERLKEFNKDIQQQAMNLLKKYHGDEKHALDVEEKAVLFFDALKKTHGMKEREKFLLKLACKLHDIGKFVNLNQHYEHSYTLIKASPILSLSEEELEMVANVSKYHSSRTPRKDHDSYLRLKGKDRVTTAKLTAILRLADAMDRSHRQKIYDVKVRQQNKEMVILGIADVDTLLEEWTFEIKSEFFQEVFGIKPTLKVKRRLTNGT
ncbi:Ppx/GppA phosphatase family protein [Tindallia californiensis]|uniref:Ppx/GppA phosphatase n=1 Tax=Tindallia californiensis TaxID=159292 RepID=A0A1H3Q1B0_9FIRM|nr:HD domain-containing protein [Tindallia californiensis]SDZ07312.1 Ppx/GppA phosphatase [Tindallia californiensis]